MQNPHGGDASQTRRPASFVRICSIVGLAAVIACDGAGGRIVPAESGATDIAIARPAFTLTDTDGNPFDFAVRTAGRLTLLEFGFTNCPDICPVHMANLAAVMSRMTPSEQMRVDVIFVSVDPDRDSLPALRKWLDSFDTRFIGLTGSRAAVDSAHAAFGFGAAIVQVAEDGKSTVIHAAPVIAITADDTAHVMYPFGTRQADWERDLPRLLAVKGRRSAVVVGEPVPAIRVTRAYVVMPAGTAPAALYLQATNFGPAADTLVSVDAGALGPVALHEAMADQSAGTTMMHAVTGVPFPAAAQARLSPGGFHGMIGPLSRPIVRGERVPVTLRFARGGVLRINVGVISYADVDTATAPSPK